MTGACGSHQEWRNNEKAARGKRQEAATILYRGMAARNFYREPANRSVFASAPIAARRRRASAQRREVFCGARHGPQSGELTRVGERRQDGELSTAKTLAYVRALRAGLLLRCRESEHAAPRAAPVSSCVPRGKCHREDGMAARDFYRERAGLGEVSRERLLPPLLQPRCGERAPQRGVPRR